jgi:hypothetical protein
VFKLSRAGAGLLAGALFSAVVATAQAPTPAPAPSRRPRLVLFLSVDQMRSDYLTRFAPLFTSGLKRLLAEGAFFSEARYRHANCETGPGHAVLLSGRHARDNGIVANAWLDRVTRRWVNVVDDPLAAPLPGPGRGASPANFIGVTVGDLLKKASPASRVVGVSFKDRSAILLGGRSADAAYWYEIPTGRFGSSTYYMKSLPPWLAAWNAEGHPDKLEGRLWERLLPDEAVYRKFAGEDDVPGEWDNVLRVFPHRIRSAPPKREFYDDLRRTPFADELLLDVVLRATSAHGLGDDDATDLLAVGFSATDVIGHTYGPDSQEVMDHLLRLDRMLGRLFEALEARVGKGQLLVGLSSDHGVLPLVEVLKARGLDAKRVKPEVVDRAVRQALRDRFAGADDLIARPDEPGFYLDEDAIARRKLRREDVEKTVKDALFATGLVDRAYTASELLAAVPGADPDADLFRASFFEPRSPQVVARVKPYVLLDGYVGGTGHGTPHDYDRHVPVVFLGPQIKAGRYEAAAGPEDIAPTLCRLLGLEYRLEAGQRVLQEALRD